jgi:hypothetical protein
LFDEQWAELIYQLSQSGVIAVPCIFKELTDDFGIHAFLAMGNWCRQFSSRPTGTKNDPMGRSKSMIFSGRFVRNLNRHQILLKRSA